MHYTQEIEAIIAVHFRLTPSSRKYDSPANRKLITERVESFGVYPSDTAVFRAIGELVHEEIIQRIDGGSVETDEAASRAADQARLDRIVAQPLTERDFDSFVRLLPSELEKKYYGDQEFRVRYDKACLQFGFRVPPKPKSLAQ